MMYFRPLTFNWDSFEQMFENFDRVFRPVYEDAAGLPAVNSWSHENGAELVLEAPGLAPENIELQAKDNLLIISGRKPETELAEGETCLTCERSCGDFSRTVQFPFRINPDKVQASLKNGVLFLAVEREEADKPRTIKVNAA